MNTEGSGCSTASGLRRAAHTTTSQRRRTVMAELNRQLQDYLAQSKGGGPSPSSSVEVEELEPVPGSWFGRWSGSGPAGSGGTSWLWSEPDPWLPGVTRKQRLLGFCFLAGAAALCFGLAALYAPLLLLYGRKFALLWSLGSLFAAAALAALRGPSRMAAGLHRSPWAAGFLCAVVGTLYAALRLRSAALTALGAGLQLALLLGGMVALVPGGGAGARVLAGWSLSALRRTVNGRVLPL